EFQTPMGPRIIQAILAGDGPTYRCEAPDLAGFSERVARTADWHRLRVEFGPDHLIVSVDDAVLRFSRRQGPGGPLRKVRLACLPAGPGVSHGDMVFDDLSIARALPPLSHHAEESGQDELWLV